ncbi:hypothetical protein [Robbsia andropogonis]|uniref:hypothetical protein n=1 Tax=Robbsia andropogonis TaxID=28092 RepID=UPI0004667CB2|nr:hypothetical protein [Robbsia andropogonis]
MKTFVWVILVLEGLNALSRILFLATGKELVTSAGGHAVNLLSALCFIGWAIALLAGGGA